MIAHVMLPPEQKCFFKQLAKGRFSYKWPGLWRCRKVSLSKLKICCPL